MNQVDMMNYPADLYRVISVRHLISHEKLFHCLYSYGIRGDFLRWLKSFSRAVAYSTDEGRDGTVQIDKLEPWSIKNSFCAFLARVFILTPKIKHATGSHLRAVTDADDDDDNAGRHSTIARATYRRLVKVSILCLSVSSNHFTYNSDATKFISLSSSKLTSSASRLWHR